MSEPRVIVDAENFILYVQHIGYTLRTLLAAASNANTGRRVWRVSYKGTIIGSVRLKTDQPHERD